MLMRHALGSTLRSVRTGRNLTLRDVAASASVSLGYLSEIERGRKEASSELLEAICTALELSVPTILARTAVLMAPAALRTPAPQLLGAPAVTPARPDSQRATPPIWRAHSPAA